jgi:hypothetical protein
MEKHMNVSVAGGVHVEALPRRYSFFKDGLECKEARAHRLGVQRDELSSVDRIKKIKHCGGAEASTLYKGIKVVFSDDLSKTDRVINGLKTKLTAQAVVDVLYEDKPAWKAVFGDSIVQTLPCGSPILWEFFIKHTIEGSLRKICETSEVDMDNVVKKMALGIPKSQAILECRCGLLEKSFTIQQLQGDFIRPILEQINNGRQPMEVIEEADTSLQQACNGTRAQFETVKLRCISGLSKSQAILESHYGPSGFTQTELKGNFIKSMIEKIDEGESPSEVIARTEAPIVQACQGLSVNVGAIIRKIIGRDISIPMAILEDYFHTVRFSEKQLEEGSFIGSMLEKITVGQLPSVVIGETKTLIAQACRGTNATPEEVKQKRLQGISLFEAVLQSHYGPEVYPQMNGLRLIQPMLTKMRGGVSPADAIKQGGPPEEKAPVPAPDTPAVSSSTPQPAAVVAVPSVKVLGTKVNTASRHLQALGAGAKAARALFSRR